MINKQVLDTCYSVFNEGINRYRRHVTALTDAITQIDSGSNEDND